MWHWFVEHLRELLIAVVVAVPFAAIFAVVVDVFRVGSRLRESIRKFNNKRAERNVTRLQERIKQLSKRRDQLASPTLALRVLEPISLCLLAMAAGFVFLCYTIACLLVFFKLTFILHSDAHSYLAVAAFFLMLTGCAFCLASVGAITAYTNARGGNEKRIEREIKQLTEEIEVLKRKLLDPRPSNPQD